ncbi:MAG: hypothetical protein IJ801_07160 [Lachnospiraceae bacterium]|nr:hypothetical protein [Lachnospiraceae bacterium]
MRKSGWKKPIAMLMAAVMLVTMTGCGSKGGSGSGNSSKQKEQQEEDTKDMVYEGTSLPIDGIEGDINTIVAKNGKLYIQTWEWIPEEGSAEGEKDADQEDSEDQADASESEEGTADKEDSESKDSAEDKEDSEGSDEQPEDADSEAEDEKKEDGDAASDIDEEDDEYYEKGTTVNRLYCTDLDGTNVKEIPLNLAENDSLGSLLVGEDDTLMYMTWSYDEKTEQSSNALVKVDADGNEAARENLTKALNLGEDSYISKILLDGKGNVIVVADQMVYILDSDLKSQGEVKSDSYLEGAALTKDGQVICASTSYSEKEGESGAQIQVLDTEGKKWDKTYKLDLNYFSGSDSIMDGSGAYDFYYKSDTGIYGYDIEGEKGTKLMDYVASNLTSDSTYNLTTLGDGRFVGLQYGYESEDGETSIVVYEKVDPSTLADKKTITFGAMWIGDDLKRAAIAFNKENKDYQITFKEYNSDSGEDPITKMNADIVAGNVPDIIDLSDLPVDQYVAKGLLEDLTPYYEKDSEIDSGDLMDSVLEAMKIDGKLYYLAPSFGISSLIAKTSDVGNETGWTFDEMKALLEKQPDDVQPFYSKNKVDMLTAFLGNGLSDFVDWQSGECAFDSQDFKDILEICNTGTNEETEYSEDSPSMPSLVQDGKILFVEGWISPEESQLYEQMFGEDITYIGYPNKEKQGSYFEFGSKIGMYAKSEVKDGVWEFIRTFMTKEYQGKTMGMYDNTPTRQDCYDLMIKAKTAIEAYTDEFGQEIEPVDSTWGWDDLEVQIKPLTKEQEERYTNLVKNTRKTGQSNSEIMEIIQEEVKPYFAGEKGLDETADIIQNRVKTYVNENR